MIGCRQQQSVGAVGKSQCNSIQAMTNTLHDVNEEDIGCTDAPAATATATITWREPQQRSAAAEEKLNEPANNSEHAITSIGGMARIPSHPPNRRREEAMMISTSIRNSCTRSQSSSSSPAGGGLEEQCHLTRPTVIDLVCQLATAALIIHICQNQNVCCL